MAASTLTTIPTFPLVGRTTELATLTELLDATAVGRGGMLLFAGETGIGKTRLVEAAREEAARRGWAFAIGRANAVEADLPYALFADALLPTIEVLTDGARAAMTRGVLDELTVLFPALASLRIGNRPPPASHDSPDFRNRLFWNFALFLKELTRETPLLAALEDLQWADASSLELLHFLVRQTSSAKVAFVCTCRSDGESGNDPLARIERSLVSLGRARVHVVPPLTHADTDELVRQSFGVPESVSRPFTALLYGWTRGNPFFIEEILKSLVESGRLRRTDRGWQGWGLEELALPASLRDTVTLRVRQLSAEAKDVAEVASVLGDRMRLQVLAAATGRSAAGLVASLAELDRHRILVDLGGSDDVVYEFGHPLVREAMYAGLGRARAGVLHGSVAEALERHWGTAAMDHAGELAYHYVRAVELELAGKAVRYLEAAGRHALQTYANPEALKYLRLAVERVESGVVELPARLRAGLVSALAHAHQRMGHTAEAIALWQKARIAAEADGDPTTVASIERRLGLAYYWSGRAGDALRHFEAGAHAARAAADNERLAVLRVARGLCLQELGKPTEALNEVSEALRLAEEGRSPWLLARVHRALALVHFWTGSSALARQHAEQALALARQTGDTVLSFWVHWSLSVLGGLTGDAEQLTVHVAQCERIAEELHSPLLRMWAAEVAIEFAFGGGRWDEALAIGEQAIAMARDLNQSTLLPRLLVWTALVHLGRNDIERGRRYADEAWELSGAGTLTPVLGQLPVDDLDTPRNVHSVIPAHIARAACHLAAREFDQAVQVAEAGLAVVQRTGYDVWAIHRLLPIAAEAALQQRDIDAAKRFGRQLRQNAEQLHNRLGLAWADACDALVIWLNGDSRRGAQLMRSAAEALEAIPFLPDATRLRRQLAGRLAEIGDRDGALRELRHVHAALLRLGAHDELERAREQFRQLDARPPARTGPVEGAAGLTGRELQIARAIAANKSNKAIGRELDIATRTVTTHLSNIYRKFGVSSRRELADALRAARLSGRIPR